MSDRTALGIDLSLTCTGLAVVGKSGVINAYPVKPPGPKKACREERTDIIIRAIKAEASGVDIIAIEEVAFAQHTAAYTIGQLSGAVRWWLWKREYPFVLITSTANKLYATGKGNASKAEMVAAAKKYLPNNKDDNVADALFLALAAQEKYDELVEEVED